jgi:hypothetical protein
MKHSTDSFISSKSKVFYNIPKDRKKEIPISERHWSTILGLDDLNFIKIYQHKIKNIKEPKLAEFNYKVLHEILPCNVNLVRWKKKSSKLCQFCDVEEAIQHLLFSCTYAKTIWQDLEQINATNIDLQDVILSDSLSHAEMFVISLVAFFIYKEWLLCSLENRPRLNNAN